MTVRDQVEWDYLSADTKDHFTYTFVFELEEAIEGYLVLRAGSKEETWLSEFLTLTPRARRGLLGLLGRYKMQTNEFIWDAPEDDALWSHCSHTEIQTKVRPSRMGRVVDVAAALSALKPAAGLEGRFCIEILDPFAPWNEGKWEVEYRNGDVQVTQTSKPPQVRADIQAFTQAFFGVLSVEKLQRQERIEVVGELGAKSLGEFLSGLPLWITGQF
jgi:predicted acetyltransferase